MPVYTKVRKLQTYLKGGEIYMDNNFSIDLLKEIEEMIDMEGIEKETTFELYSMDPN